MIKQKITEKYLLFQLQTKQDPDAFAKLYDLYARRIYSFIYFKVSSKEEAEDITSDVFLKAWNYISEKKSVESFSGLLYRLARNSIIDLYRSKARQGSTRSLEDYNEDIDVGDKRGWEENFGNKLEAEKILEALKKLKQEYREVITLKYVDELDVSEISEITGKGGVSVRVTLHRGLKKLKELLDK